VSIREARDAIARAMDALADARVALAEASGSLPRLTPREREILVLLSQRLDGDEIGQRLGISPKTADNIALMVTRKLGAHSRREAIELFEQMAAGRVIRPAPQLTEREKAILPLLAEGLTNTQIAERLAISLSATIGSSLGLSQKLGAQDRKDAVRRAREYLEHGQVPPVTG
jgi:DNA-binding CsgD family transcriptional regulator